MSKLKAYILEQIYLLEIQKEYGLEWTISEDCQLSSYKYMLDLLKEEY